MFEYLIKLLEPLAMLIYYFIAFVVLVLILGFILWILGYFFILLPFKCLFGLSLFKYIEERNNVKQGILLSFDIKTLLTLFLEEPDRWDLDKRVVVFEKSEMCLFEYQEAVEGSIKSILHKEFYYDKTNPEKYKKFSMKLIDLLKLRIYNYKTDIEKKKVQENIVRKQSIESNLKFVNDLAEKLRLREKQINIEVSKEYKDYLEKLKSVSQV